VPDINLWLVKRPERTGPHVSGPGGRPSLQGFAASGAAAQERRPHRVSAARPKPPVRRGAMTAPA